MATKAKATPTKRKRRSRKSKGLRGFPTGAQMTPIFKAVGMIVGGFVIGNAANNMVGGMVNPTPKTEGFDAMGLIAPLATTAAGIFMVNNPNTKYFGLGLAGAGAVSAVKAVTQTDLMNLPALSMMSKATTTSTTTTPVSNDKPVKGMGNIPYLEFDDEDEDEPVEGFDNDMDDEQYEQEQSALPQSTVSEEPVTGLYAAQEVTFM